MIPVFYSTTGLTKILVELNADFKTILSSCRLKQGFETKLWWDSPLVAMQFEGIGDLMISS